MNAMISRILLFVVVLFGVIQMTVAQRNPSDNIITVTPSVLPAQNNRHEILHTAIRVKIAPGWHINSHTPTFDYLIATELEFKSNQKFSISNIQYPQGKKVQLGFADQPIDLYEGSIEIYLDIQLIDQKNLIADTIHGTLTAQACNNQTCLAPMSIDIAIPFSTPIINTQRDTTPVIAAKSNVASSPSIQTQQPELSNPTAKSPNRFESAMEEKGLLLTLVAIFFVGLALNLTPCVYPMLSVTVSLFGGQSETHVIRVFIKAVVYVLGIATMYSVLGVTAALGGGLFGSWLQSPWVLGGIAALLFALALSSFGLYQIQLPYWLTSKLGGTTGTGFIATYLSGLAVGVFAAPCVGPPVIALLTFVASKGSVWYGFLTFFTLSLGLGFPYLILGTFSGLLKKIPRSGSWLVWVEHIFGVILTAAALFYLLLATAPNYAFDVIPAALILGGIILGFVDRSGREKMVLKRIQWLFGILTISAGIWFLTTAGENTIVWEKYTDSVLEQAKEKNLPVLIDFSADWCIPCKELDRNTWSSQEVIDATKHFVRVKVDLTKFDSPESETLRRKFQITGVPTVILLRPDGTEAVPVRSVGYFTPEELLKKLSTQSFIR